MKKITIIIFTLVTTVLLAFRLFTETPVIRFLNSLTEDQRMKVQLPFDHPSKTFWHYLPVSRIPREGIKLLNLNTNQKKLLNNVLQSFLSETGYIKTKKIMDLENILLEITGDSVKRNPEKYSVAFYGDPEKDSLC